MLLCQRVAYNVSESVHGVVFPGGTPIEFGWGCAAGFSKVLPFTRPNFANFLTLYQTKNAQLFLISIFCEWDLILDEFSMISRPNTRPNGLKTIPFPAAHTRIANIWEYPPPGYCPISFVMLSPYLSKANNTTTFCV